MDAVTSVLEAAPWEHDQGSRRRLIDNMSAMHKLRHAPGTCLCSRPSLLFAPSLCSRRRASRRRLRHARGTAKVNPQRRDSGRPWCVGQAFWNSRAAHCVPCSRAVRGDCRIFADAPALDQVSPLSDHHTAPAAHANSNMSFHRNATLCCLRGISLRLRADSRAQPRHSSSSMRTRRHCKSCMSETVRTARIVPDCAARALYALHDYRGPGRLLQPLPPRVGRPSSRHAPLRRLSRGGGVRRVHAHSPRDGTRTPSKVERHCRPRHRQ